MFVIVVFSMVWCAVLSMRNELLIRNHMMLMTCLSRMLRKSSDRANPHEEGSCVGHQGVSTCIFVLRRLLHESFYIQLQRRRNVSFGNGPIDHSGTLLEEAESEIANETTDCCT